MTRFLKTAALTLVLAVIVLYFPQNGLAQDAKIATVDVQALTLMSDEGKALGERLEKRYQEISAELQKEQKAIEEKETRLRTQDRLMSATAKAQLAKEIDDAKIIFDRKNQDYQKEMDDLQRDLLSPVAAKVQQELSAYVNEKGYTLLIDLSAAESNVVWFNPANDVTRDVMGRLNAAYKSSPAAKTPAPAAEKPATPPAPPPAQN
jgi:Skp family chaperone for outer membrane proteins